MLALESAISLVQSLLIRSFVPMEYSTYIVLLTGIEIRVRTEETRVQILIISRPVSMFHYTIPPIPQHL